MAHDGFMRRRYHDTEWITINEAPEGNFARIDYFRWVNRRWASNVRWFAWVELGASL